MSLFFYGMSRKFLVVLFFIVVFGLPVLWYFILQIFGENKFDLPKLERINNSCISQQANATLLIDSASIEGRINDWNRLKSKMSQVDSKAIDLKVNSSCNMNYSALLVERDGEVRGQYSFTREEVDRVITEIDIYLLNLKKSE